MQAISIKYFNDVFLTGRTFRNTMPILLNILNNYIPLPSFKVSKYKLLLLLRIDIGLTFLFLSYNLH